MSISLHYLKSKPFNNKAEQKEVKKQRKELRKELKESKVDASFLQSIPLFTGLEEVTYHKIAKRMQHTSNGFSECRGCPTSVWSYMKR